ncbi:amidohydrolase [Aestuariibacter halophilus]|uniref:Amidohydrolase n=1 Tax=Fluctibacter halophilus TaxID=226011 RepID=A0ABS8GBC5_9ALTE|nr:amidohydrolase [Aestuariibacter halophilus]MCC2617882.1 amidohydrolase [Aestuariibacter halophilus]
MRIITLLVGFFVSLSALAKPIQFVNVNGYTYTPQGELRTFSSIVIEDDIVLATYEPDSMQHWPEAQTIDLAGKTMLPGLIDAHGHLLGLGDTLLKVDVRDQTSAERAAQQVQAYAQGHPQLRWIVGRGWNQVLWPGKQFPTAAQLDEYVSDRPVFLERVDGHAAWLNSKALTAAGINKDSVSPPGGKIEKGPDGEPTGILIDNAMNLVTPLLPKADDDYLSASLEAAGEHLLSVGITSMHDAGIPANVYNFYQQQATQQRMPVRVYAMLAATEPTLLTLLQKGPVYSDDGMLSIRSVKAYGDGALGSRGAALLAPYSDAADNQGLLLTAEQDMKDLFDTVIGYGYQLNYHAIGDKANRYALDQYQDTFKRVGGKALRHRIEHAQVIALTDIPRFAELSVIASVQPTHATSDMNMAEDRLGKERLKGAYAWQRLLDAGATLAFGSDFPVELANPFYGLHAAVTRQDRNDQPVNGWIPEQGVTLQQAFKAFTLDAAYAAHQEHRLGTLTAGKYADFIVIDRDIFQRPASELWQVKVEQTWLAGKQVYSAQ